MITENTAKRKKNLSLLLETTEEALERDSGDNQQTADNIQRIHQWRFGLLLRR